MSDKPQVIYLKDYQPSEYLIESVDLHFLLNEDVTTVTAKSQVVFNPAASTRSGVLSLDGNELKLISVAINDKLLTANDYEVNAEKLILKNMPDSFDLTVVTEITPQNNTALEGLYKSSGMYCTQCEAEGFRRITYFLDRPDVMAVYTTTVNAEKAKYPVLLSNGNCIDSGETHDGRHWIKWHDPFPKPSYLFALVAGDLYCQEDEFTTRSGRQVTLKIFVEEVNKTKCDHALASLKKAMKWDE
ncbi:MAG: aminopeptidase N, partial [Gammaproteobacteria bacterium]|nr:aminopeptidase N [Gammaproteobacteria bacterium]